MSATPDDCFHLSIDTVREIHGEAIRQFGGLDGIRDENLLASAVLAPQSRFGGKSPYVDTVEVAAAYLFYLCKNHPFLDGNKRTAMMAAIVFLRLNGIEPSRDSPDWEKLMLDVANGQLDREMTTRRLRQLVRDRRRATSLSGTPIRPSSAREPKRRRKK
ncbi:MAG: type II toxin-antitoxin system death-on-curing family toxin [Chthoniobacterales bacterium]